MNDFWLGFESSCDETACAVLQTDLTVLANPLYSQIQEHQAFGGVVPEIAARAHLSKIRPMLDAALEQSGVPLNQIGAIAFTRGPGLMGPLLVGAAFARGLAMDLGVPVYGVHHLEGHIAAAHLSNLDLEPPYVALTVSGGHTELTLIEPGFHFQNLGRTRDDAAGEAFDKCGKLLGLGYPAGPVVSRFAATGDRKFVRFPQGLQGSDTCDFSFSGLKTAVLRYTQEKTPEFIQKNCNHICASLEYAIVEILVRKASQALASTHAPALVLCGGVSANAYLRNRLQLLCERMGVRFAVPAFEFCTDNGAMIAAAAILRHRVGLLDPQWDVRPWLPLCP
ncbi:MAG TPA: tRNA (adenosine(37)-N6)-threonylcarbamoyltransferase complex transferase subunit TsaD [Fibrobacteraceae bacterium]|nr:tRNA (adenosine(37)-N6)-threonylcarbamoyltransferase complex transferase subunit TsaD [Fibrobacteraceae bacterium]